MINWRKSTFSGQAGNCVEVAEHEGAAAIRNSLHPDRGTLTLDPAAVAAFVDACSAGECDDLT